MDKLFNNNWVVKIVSFVLALMLYAIVSAGDNPSPSSPSSVAVNPTQQTSIVTETLALKYNDNRYVVSGAPQTVNVRLIGSNESILKAKLLNSKSAYLDLTNMKPGTYDVRVQTHGFPSGLTVRPSPKTVRVTIQKKTSKELPVAIDILNKNALADGYSLKDPVIDTQSVTVTGGEDTVDSIAFVKGVINVKGADATVDKMISLHAYNNNGDQVDVAIDPSAIQVRVPVDKVSKQLGVNAETTGSPAKGYSVGSVDLSASQVTVTAADSDTLRKITTIDPLSVSVDGLKKDKTFSVTVPVPTGATKVSPKKIDVTVHIVKETAAENAGSSASSSSGSSDTGQQTKRLSNIPIHVIGLKDGLNATFNDEDHVTVSVTGSAQALARLSSSDINAQVDLSNLDTGKHQVAVAVNVPDGLQTEVNPGMVNVSIS
ncbi:YbbR-like domain-containing protein [Sporolactobacillus kofuensis]|uniref:YbbR-like domain-containing protein n=1 Tax=Sporolactobacillus kofuensis TaxID=269672 RepID=A0ABW1WG73_9BACL|nr:CdaR family protein [Sporolactobacillus kofuensis]MCO7177070.1 CdaR family protein [Sporolactobacillus kofuensis]